MNEAHLILSYEAIESMAKNESLKGVVDELELELTLSASPVAMRILRAQMAAIRLLHAPVPRIEH